MMFLLRCIFIILTTGMMLYCIQFKHYKEQGIFCGCILVFGVMEFFLIEDVRLIYVNIGVLGILVAWRLFLRLSCGKYLFYRKVGQTHFSYSKKRVMVIVPHEDDELNLVSDMIGNYIDQGNEVYVVYATNGDYRNQGKQRINDAIKVCQKMGIVEKNIIFLGYGDQWEKYVNKEGKEIKHIYHAEDERVVKSYAGYEKTYGTIEHQAYSDGKIYTRNNYLEDLQNVILEFRPEIIYAVDYDPHADHRTLSLMFEEAMCNILRNQIEYYPIIYKGYCYSTAYYAKPDFDNCLNIESTVELVGEKYENNVNPIFEWKERIRFPVNTKLISRSLVNCYTYKLLAQYTTQPAKEKADRIINGDKVFWERYTTSILYNATISDKYGEVNFLNDFKLVDTKDITDVKNNTCDVYWKPYTVNGILNNKLDVKMECEKEISEIWIYAFFKNNSYINRAYVQFDNGEKIIIHNFGEDDGILRIKFDKKYVKDFSIIIEEWNGDIFGIVEIEAYRTTPFADMKFIKLQDLNGNFVYDDLTTEDEDVYMIYSYPKCEIDLEKEYNVRVQKQKGNAFVKVEKNSIRISGSKNRKYILNVCAKENSDIVDTIQVEHLTEFQKKCILYYTKHTYLDIINYYKTLFQIVKRKL